MPVYKIAGIDDTMQLGIIQIDVAEALGFDPYPTYFCSGVWEFTVPDGTDMESVKKKYGAEKIDRLSVEIVTPTVNLEYFEEFEL